MTPFTVKVVVMPDSSWLCRCEKKLLHAIKGSLDPFFCPLCRLHRQDSELASPGFTEKEIGLSSRREVVILSSEQDPMPRCFLIYSWPSS